MANVPYTGTQTVEAQFSPTPMQHLDVNPAMFGAGVGAAEQRAGAELGQAGDTAFQTGLRQQQLHNELWANDANTNAMKAMAQEWGKYNALQGQAALQAHDGYQQAVEKIYADTVAAAPSPMAANLVGRTARFMTDQFIRYGQNYYNQQSRAWDQKSLADSANGWMAQSVLALNNPDVMMKTIDAGSADIRHRVSPMLLGPADADGNYGANLPPDARQRGQAAVDAEVLKYRGNTALEVVRDALAQGNIAGAVNAYARIKTQTNAKGETVPGIDGVNMARIETMLRPRLTDALANDIAVRARAAHGQDSPGGSLMLPAGYQVPASLGWTHPDQSAPTLGAATGDFASLNMRAEGSGPDRSGPGGTPASSANNGFVSGTWDDLRRKHPEAGLPETSAAATPDQLRTATNLYAADNTPILQQAGYGPTPTNLRLAHSLGPYGAVAVLNAADANPDTPAESVLSPDAITANPRSLGGKTVGQVVADAQKAMAGATSPAASAPMASAKDIRAGAAMGRADILNTAMAMAGNNLDLQKSVQQWVSRYHQVDQANAQAAIYAQEQAQSQSTRMWGDQIRQGNYQPGWWKDPNLTEQQVEGLDRLARDVQKERGQGPAGDYGPGYNDIQKRILDPASPNRIYTLGALQAEYSHGALTPSGMKAAAEWLDWSQKPENHDAIQATSNFWKDAEKKVTLENPMLNLKLPGSDDRWNKALPAITDALNTNRAHNIPDRVSFDPNSKDSVWPVLKPYLPTQAEAAAFQVNAEKVASSHQLAPLDLTSTEGVVAAYKAGRLPYAQAQDALVKLGVPLTGAPATPTAPMGQ